MRLQKPAAGLAVLLIVVSVLGAVVTFTTETVVEPRNAAVIGLVAALVIGLALTTARTRRNERTPYW